MLPEQVWDEASAGHCGARAGQPAGSAQPLVWAHAEYLKLLRSALDGKVFDRIDAVYERYCEPEGRSKLSRDVEIWSRHRPIQEIAAGNRLRILEESYFELTWTDDAWKTQHSATSRSLGSVGYSADIVPGMGAKQVEWTLRWPERDAWLGYNVVVEILDN
jgi:glucoamylase